MELKQKSWQSSEAQKMAENGVVNPIGVVTHFLVAQAIVVAGFDLFPILCAEWRRLVAMEQDGQEHCYEELALDFAQCLLP